jgi:hypothetical protein
MERRQMSPRSSGRQRRDASLLPAHLSYRIVATLISVLGVLAASACASDSPATSDTHRSGEIGAGTVAATRGATGDITGITFDWSTYVRTATGSDNWPLTWCDDGHQYTSWGDGGGFGGSDDDGRVSLGFARVEGDYPRFSGINVWGGRNGSRPATFRGKVESMLCIDGTLYGLVSPRSDVGGWDYKEAVKSPDKGLSWTVVPDSRLVGDAHGAPGLPFYVQYGQNYGANSDGYVYIFTIRIADPDAWEVQKPGVAWLARAPVAGEAFVYPARWEWLTGMNDSNPRWGRQADRVPILEDADGFMRGSATYLPHLDRYVMVQNHSARNRGNIAIYQAPKPWGPWTVVMKESEWPRRGAPRQFAYGNFSPKWLSPDGACVFVWFRPDAWNSVGCRFETA